MNDDSIFSGFHTGPASSTSSTLKRKNIYRGNRRQQQQQKIGNRKLTSSSDHVDTNAEMRKKTSMTKDASLGKRWNNISSTNEFHILNSDYTSTAAVAEVNHEVTKKKTKNGSSSSSSSKHNIDIGKPSSNNNSGGGGGGGGGKKTVISSLFTSNPNTEINDMKRYKRSDNNNAGNVSVFSTDMVADLPLNEKLRNHLTTSMGITTLTTIQRLAIPQLLHRKDAAVKAATGSGKTLVYVLPIVESLLTMSPQVRREDGLLALVMAPTRELALQILEVFNAVLRPFPWLVPGIVMGGEKKKSEKARLRRGVNVLVATPGRFLDHLMTTKCLSAERVRWLILDEADRLMDLGFEKDITAIVGVLDQRRDNSVDDCIKSTRRQNVLCSATLQEGVRSLAQQLLHKPAMVDASKEGGANGSSANDFSTPTQLRQQFVIVPTKLRLVTLVAFLRSHCKPSNPKSKIVVFMSCRSTVEFIHTMLSRASVEEDTHGITVLGEHMPLFKLHGRIEQKQRTQVYFDFCEATSGVLFCTDVAARGLHLPAVDWIVQYVPPLDPADYVHRVGRTARIGQQGNALLFLSPSEIAYVDILRQSTGNQAELIPIKVTEILQTLCQPGSDKSKFEDMATKLHATFERLVLSDDGNITELARDAYMSYIRAYSTYPVSLKAIFHIKNLHLGHVAKSFALREAPATIKNANTKSRRNSSKNNNNGNDSKPSGSTRLASLKRGDRSRKEGRSACGNDEFSSGGVMSMKKKRKRNPTYEEF